MTRKRARLILWIVLEVLFIALVCIGSVYDFDISYALSGVHVEDGKLVSGVGFLAKAMEVLGEWPALIFASFSLLVISRNLRKKADDTKILMLLISSNVIVLALMFWGWRSTFKDIVGKSNIKGWYYVIMAVLAVVFTLMLRSVVSKIQKQTLKSMFAPAIVTVFAALAILVTVEVIKNAWGRVRLREIIEANDVSLFTSWYIPNFFSGSKSFPSGHTANGTLLFLIPIWLNKNVKEKTRRKITIFTGVWTALLAFSRLAAGAHYLTDVTFGFVIAFIIVQIATIKYEQVFDNKPLPALIRTTEVAKPDSANAAKSISSSQRGFDNARFSPTLQNYPDAAKPKATAEQAPKPQRKATLPAREIKPPEKASLTSFSLDKIRAEKAKQAEEAAAMAEAQAKHIDDQFRRAATSEISRFKDMSVPVVPKSAASAQPRKKRSNTSQHKKMQSNTDSVQMHFHYDTDSQKLTSEISDE